MAKESVRRRLEDAESGMSYTEFSYALLQSYDFLELYRREGCTVQMGGSDQWGNITAGIDLVRRVDGARAFGVVFPLLTSASGAKFGKSEAGNVWLDAELTSPFRFFQYWLNVDDADVMRFVRLLTLLPSDQVAALERAVASEPQQRAAQRALATDVTRRLHGETGLAAAERATRALFGGDLEGLGADDIADVFADVPSSEIGAAALAGEGASLVDVLVESGVASSKGDARRAIEGGGVYVNGVRADDVLRRVRMDDAIEGRFVLLRRGKKSYHLVAVRR
jgi:tyrosyl-tRNA synthetase